MNGLLLVNKPPAHTSFDVIARLRGATGIRRIGHTGTLDPLATGVLPVLFGRCAKFADLLPDTDKRYTAGIRLGVTTDTLDITGKVLSRRASRVTKTELEAALRPFRGEIEQLPPMYSAVKIAGVRLYEMARRGETVERAPRTVVIKELELLSFDEAAGDFSIDVRCSKGAYIRSLCADIGDALGCGAVLTSLVRTEACGFALARCTALEDCLQNGPERYLLPPDAALTAYAPLFLTAGQTARFQNGVKLPFSLLSLPDRCTKYLRVYDPEGRFIGLAQPDCCERLLRVKVLFLCGDGKPE